LGGKDAHHRVGRHSFLAKSSDHGRRSRRDCGKARR
jgi:hypothetical protein